MSGYLKRYVGTYRVKADIDLDTNDFPRMENGTLDPSFDDYYIDCKNDIKIRHGVGSVLSCYIPSRTRGMNTLKQIYEERALKDAPKEQAATQKYLENLCKALVAENILVSAEVLDGEVYFEFKADMIDYIAKLVGAKTYGATISPLSPKNLPRTPYKIPDKDLKTYKEAIKNLPTRSTTIGGKTMDVVDVVILNEANRKFDKIIAKTKNIDVGKDRRSKCLKTKEYIHSLGMWQQYCEFLQTFTI